MATETVPNSTNDASSSSASLADVRDRTLYEAASEAGALASVFRQNLERDSGSFQFGCAIRGALLRIELLCTAVCILQGEDWRINLGEEFHVVFGKPLGVGHD